ncbi:Arginine repressor [Cedecea lapagei]|uniref:Arginine repressor n=1 Tax=Cedecea lapagei TaxID=158823 RepID=A0A3S4JWL2_9ENTR|nr:ArgR family transcriptional regulator [Cedecea lapagei]VEB95294.1 Arginine repressor [Cedecea lapagei]
MRISRLSSEKEQRQLELCQQLISHKSYHSQEQLRCDLKQHGFEAISQSTVSRLLKLLGVIKLRNAKGQKIYALSPLSLPKPNAARSVSEMVISVEHNSEFVMVHTVAGYGKAIAKILDHHAMAEILGVVAGSSVVWIAPREIRKTAQVHSRIVRVLGLT